VSNVEIAAPDNVWVSAGKWNRRCEGGVRSSSWKGDGPYYAEFDWLFAPWCASFGIVCRASVLAACAEHT